MPRRRYLCPECGTLAGVRIVYGFPDDNLAVQAERQEVHLGGCCEEIGAPGRHCNNCGYEWVSLRPHPNHSGSNVGRLKANKVDNWPS